MSDKLALAFFLTCLISCKHAQTQNTSSAMDRESSVVPTPYSCDSNPESFAARGIQPYLSCTTNDVTDPGRAGQLTIKIAKIDITCGEIRKERYRDEMQICFRQPPEQELTILQKSGFDSYDPNAFLASYAVNIMGNGDVSFGIGYGELMMPGQSGPKNAGERECVPGAYYHAHFDERQNGYRYGEIKMRDQSKGQDEIIRPLICVQKSQ